MKIPNNKPAWAEYFVVQNGAGSSHYWMSKNKIQACNKDGKVITIEPSFIENEEFEEYLAGEYGLVCHKFKRNMENK